MQLTWNLPLENRLKKSQIFQLTLTPHNGIKMDQWFPTRRNTLGQHLIGLDGSKLH